MRLSLRQHPRKELPRHFLVQQAFSVLAEHGMVPHRLIHLQAHEPPEKQVIVQLLHQQPLAAYRVEDLQKHGSEEALRWHRWSPVFACMPSKSLAIARRLRPQTCGSPAADGPAELALLAGYGKIN